MNCKEVLPIYLFSTSEFEIETGASASRIVDSEASSFFGEVLVATPRRIVGVLPVDFRKLVENLQ